MAFDTLRNFDTESPIMYCFNSKTSPLIKIDTKRNITYYTTKAQKLTAIKEAKKSDKFIIAWSGQWSTDVFNVSEIDIDEIYLSQNK